MDQSSWDDTLQGVRPSPGPGRGAVSRQSSRDKRPQRSLPGTTVRKEGRAISDRPTVLYACIHNSGRSVAAQVLAERGLPVTDHTPTQLDVDLVERADVVITMGCGETCPVFPGKRYEDWTVDDPAGEDLETVRRIVDDIDGRVRALLADLGSISQA